MAAPAPRLLKWQRNKIVESIQAAGLDPREFDLNDSDAGFLIKHKWSESFFDIVGDPGHYGGRYRVWDAPDWPYQGYTWNSMISRFGGWLEDVKRDLEMPDLSKRLGSGGAD